MGEIALPAGYEAMLALRCGRRTVVFTEEACPRNFEERHEALALDRTGQESPLGKRFNPND